MKDWLDKQGAIEKDVLKTVASQAQGVVDDLLPQIRLAALENEMQSTILMEIHFDFDDDKTTIRTEASVHFPPKHSASVSVEL
jgi:hypothetical protein